MTDSNKTNVRREKIELFVLGAMYLLGALFFTKIYFASTMEWRQAPLERLVNFTADIPFQYRVLVPFIIKVVHVVTNLPLFLLWQATTVVLVLGLIVCYRLFLLNFFSGRIASIGALVLLYPMYWNYCVYGLWRIPTDFSAILFFVLGLHFLYSRRWLLFYVVFFLGVLNRETIIFLIFALPVGLDWKSDRREIFLHAFLLIVIFVGVKILLMNIFAGNEGGIAQIQIRSNLKNLVGFKTVVQTLLSFGAIWIFIPLGWKRHPKFLRGVGWLVIPFFGVMMIVANLHELRVYGELIPIVTGLALSGFLTIWDKGIKVIGYSGS